MVSILEAFRCQATVGCPIMTTIEPLNVSFPDPTNSLSVSLHETHSDDILLFSSIAFSIPSVSRRFEIIRFRSREKSVRPFLFLLNHFTVLPFCQWFNGLKSVYSLMSNWLPNFLFLGASSGDGHCTMFL